MKSVCILLHNYYDIDIRVRRKAEALVAAGYSVDVFALGKPNAASRYNLDGVNVYTISLGKKRGSLARYVFEYMAFFLWSLVRLTLKMPSRRYAVVDVNTLPDFLVFAAVFAKWMGAKVVLDMHEITPEFYMSKYSIGPDSRLIRLLEYVEKISFNYADHVITINDPILNLLVGRGLKRSNATIIMNAADEKYFVSYPRSSAADAVAKPGAFVMMYHGTLTKIYGLDIAIESFAMAHKDMPGAEFWILGDGTEAESLRALIHERGLDSKVKLIGRVPPAEIPAWLEKCDIGVLPIRRDVFLEFASPNKLVEYIIMGRAVVISRLKAIQYYFSDDALAYCEPNDPKSLAAQMICVYRDSELRSLLASKAKQEYQPLRWDVMKQKYLELMAEIAGTVPGAEQVPAAETSR